MTRARVLNRRLSVARTGRLERRPGSRACAEFASSTSFATRDFQSILRQLPQPAHQNCGFGSRHPGSRKGIRECRGMGEGPPQTANRRDAASGGASTGPGDVQCRLIAWLETELDRDALTHPRPGRPSCSIGSIAPNIPTPSAICSRSRSTSLRCFHRTIPPRIRQHRGCVGGLARVAGAVPGCGRPGECVGDWRYGGQPWLRDVSRPTGSCRRTSTSRACRSGPLAEPWSAIPSRSTGNTSSKSNCFDQFLGHARSRVSTTAGDHRRRRAGFSRHCRGRRRISRHCSRT